MATLSLRSGGQIDQDVRARFVQHTATNDRAHPLWGDGNCLAVWLRVEEMAAYGAHVRSWCGRQVAVAIDQVLLTQDQLAESLGLSRKAIRRCLDKLVDLGWIVVRAIGRVGHRKLGSLVTVCFDRANKTANSLRQKNKSLRHITDEDFDEGPLKGPALSEELEHKIQTPIGGSGVEIEQVEKLSDFTLGSPKPPVGDPETSPEPPNERPEGLTAVEAETLAYVEAQVGQRCSPFGADVFVQKWRDLGWTPEQVRAEAQAFGGNPWLRGRTQWLTRLFHRKKALGEYAGEMRYVDDLIGEALRNGDAPEHIAKMARPPRGLDYTTFCAYVLNRARKLEGRAQEMVRL